MEQEKMPGKIRKLEETVINRIAAGEVIQRPANALKELLENSLDAGSNSIQVVVRSGGMKLLQIQDDGSGIRKEDLPIVCERFTTSKLEKFEDLQSIGTYGFRGEALASISHVAHLTIVTKTQDSPCAFRAEYSDGKLKQYPDKNNQNPRPCAGKQGTMIIVEDLFYNMDTRRRALKSAAEEHNKIVDVVTKYAIHNANVGFSLKKVGETMTEVRTPSRSSVLDNIKLLYGAAISRELMEITCDDKSTGFTLKGYVSNANYSTKKLTFLLFINHRLVDSSALRKSIESVYYNYLPKGSHPFVYLSIEIDPRNVDVNVHPTKHEVHFLHEDVIVTTITNSAENVLLGSNHSRTFMVQSLLPGASSLSTTAETSNKTKTGNNASVAKSGPSLSQTAPKNLVRTDPKMQKIDKFLSSTPDPDVSTTSGFHDSPSCINLADITALPSASTSKGNSSPIKDQTKQNRREIRLRSIKNLKHTVEADASEQLLSAFKNHTFVGCVDRSTALIQHDVNLYICNSSRLSAEMFYQKMLFEFGNLGRIEIADPITVKELAMFALESDEYTCETKSAEQVATEVQNLLVGKSQMLNDYFSFSIQENGTVSTIPLIIDNYFPSMEEMPNYIMNLAKNVKWEEEQACFQTFCSQTALFYAIQPGTNEDNENMSLNGHTWKWTIEHVIYPEIKKCLLPPKSFADDSTVVLLTSLPELYKVFERC